jgi:hypothetical protein
MIGATGCEDFLDTESYTKKNSSNFPINATDADQLLVGVYATLNKTQNNTQCSPLLVMELASDDRFGGGGANDKLFQSYNQLMISGLDELRPTWTVRYQGVNRANMAIASIESAMAEGDEKNQKLGEALYLRAYSYFDLAQLFGNVPLIEAAPENVDEAKTPPAQRDAKEIMQFVLTDLWRAYEMMPVVQWSAVQSGVVTKWAAAAMLARVYLFYDGFHANGSLEPAPLVAGEEGGKTSLTKEDVIGALDNLKSNSGHSLTPDYRSIWAYTNSTAKAGGPVVTGGISHNVKYDYVADAPTWIRDGENAEVVFAIKCTSLASWNADRLGNCNQLALFFGIRNGGSGGDQYVNTFPFGQGWGAGPVNPQLWNEWSDDDPRKKASIYNVEDEATDLEGATPFRYGFDAQWEETGLWQKKIIAYTRTGKDAQGKDVICNHFGSSSAYYAAADELQNAGRDNFQLGFATDIILIRYADVLLMHSELTGTPDGINQVRARVRLPAVGYSMENLQKERRYELAFEGTRWLDLRRWKIAATQLEKTAGVPIYNSANPAVQKSQAGGFASRYQLTNGYWPIPDTEVTLSGGAFKQNPGWGATEGIYVNWAN